jgi:DNA-binding MarR family transcriptional regulator
VDGVFLQHYCFAAFKALAQKDGLPRTEARDTADQPMRGQSVPPPQTAETAASADENDSVKYGELNNHLGYFVRRAQYWIFRDVNSKLERLKLDVIRYSILELISANPGINQIQLSGALGIERARLVALLDELQGQDLLVRKRSVTDRRSHELHLTAVGSTVLKEANVLITAHEERLIRRMGSENYSLALQGLSAFKLG